MPRRRKARNTAEAAKPATATKNACQAPAPDVVDKPNGAGLRAVSEERQPDVPVRNDTTTTNEEEDDLFVEQIKPSLPRKSPSMSSLFGSEPEVVNDPIEKSPIHKRRRLVSRKERESTSEPEHGPVWVQWRLRKASPLRRYDISSLDMTAEQFYAYDEDSQADFIGKAKLLARTTNLAEPTADHGAHTGGNSHENVTIKLEESDSEEIVNMTTPLWESGLRVFEEELSGSDLEEEQMTSRRPRKGLSKIVVESEADSDSDTFENMLKESRPRSGKHEKRQSGSLNPTKVYKHTPKCRSEIQVNDSTNEKTAGDGDMILIQRVPPNLQQDVSASSRDVIIISKDLLALESQRLFVVFLEEHLGVGKNRTPVFFSPGKTNLTNKNGYFILNWTCLLSETGSPDDIEVLTAGKTDQLQAWNALKVWTSWLMEGKGVITVPGSLRKEKLRLAAVAMGHYLQVIDKTFFDKIWSLPTTYKMRATVCFKCGQDGHQEIECTAEEPLSGDDQVKLIRKYGAERSLHRGNIFSQGRAQNGRINKGRV